MSEKKDWRRVALALSDALERLNARNARPESAENLKTEGDGKAEIIADFTEEEMAHEKSQTKSIWDILLRRG